MRRLLRIRRTPFLLLAPLFLALGGCGGGGGAGGSATGWTVLVYMVADNNLEPDALTDLQEMAAVGSGDGLRIVVQIDRSADYSNDPLGNIPDFTTTKRLLVESGRFTELQDLGEIDTGNQSAFQDFIEWGLKNYGSAHNLLVLWDHGGALMGAGVDETPERDIIKPDEIAAAVAQGLQNAGKSSFDIIGFDACLMGTLEIAEILKPYAGYLIGSEDTEPAHGWDYQALSIAKSATVDAVTLGTHIVDGYQAQAESEGTAANITLSLIDLAKLDPIESALSAFHTAYPKPNLTIAVVTQIGTSRGKALEFAKNPNPSKSYNMVDAGDLFDLIAKSVPDATTAGQVRDALTAAVVHQVKGSARTNAYGLTIYFPPAKDYYSAAYDAAPRMESWAAFLKDYYDAGDEVTPPAFADCNTTSNCSLTKTLNSVTLSVALTSGSLARVVSKKLYYGVPDGSGGAYIYGDNPATTSSSSGVDWVQGTWDYTVIEIEQGSSKAFGYLSNPQSVGTGQVQATIPLTYLSSASASSGPIALWQVTYNTTSFVVTQSEYYLVDDSGGVGPLTPASGTYFKTIVLYQPDMDYWSTLQWQFFTDDPAFDATQPLALASGYLQSGYQGYILLRVENAAGDGAGLYATPTRPSY